MKVISVIIIILVGIFFTKAAETNDEDSNSPLVSYLLAKIQRLESKLSATTNSRNTRQVEQKRSAVANETAVKNDAKAGKCSPSTMTYIRWGNSTCEYGADTMYSGFAGGGSHGHKGSPANMLCLPPDPQYYSSSSSGSQYIYGVEYEISGVNSHAHDRNMPCALCKVTGRSTTVMIPSHYECPVGWRKEYNGYIMAGYYSQEGSTMYNCIDKSLEQIPGSGSNQNPHVLYTVYAVCGHYFPCSSTEMTCVVCSY